MSNLYAASFSGSNHLEAPNYTGNPPAFTVSCRVNLSTGQASRVFFSNYQATGDAGWAPGISDGTPNQLKFYLGGNTVVGPVISSGVWYQCVFTYDGTTAKIYLDGDTTPVGSLVSAVVYGAAPASNSIGSLNASSQKLNGRLAEVGYWPRDIGTAGVTALWNAGQGRTHAELPAELLAGLASYHDFGDSTNLGLDSTANDRDFTNSGGVTRGNGPGFVALWSDPATWGGGTPPGDGATATVSQAITVAADTTVGASGASGTTALTITAAGTLTIAAGVTLRVRGDLIVSGNNAAGDVRILLGPGSRILFDGTAAPASTAYKLQMGTGHFQLPMLRARGTAGAPATIASDTTGGALPAYYANGETIGQGQIDAEYLDFVDFGDATNPAWMPYMGSVSNYVRLVNCTFTRTGGLANVADMTAGSTFLLQHCKFTATPAPYSLSIGSTSAMAGGTRSITYCSFDKMVRLYPPLDFTITYNVFLERWVHLNYEWAEFAHNFFRDPLQEAFGACGDVRDCYLLEDSGSTNPHGIGVSLDKDIVFERLVIESTLAEPGGGDFVFPHSPANPHTFTLRDSILLPNAGAYSTPGKIVAMLGGVNTNAVIEHCTYAVSDESESGVMIGETYSGHAGQINSLKSNLAWRPTPGSGGYKLIRWATTVQDLVSAATADYNWGWNLAAGSEGNGYHANDTATPIVSTGTLGAHDGSGDPQFVDPTRNLATWAVAACGSAAGTVAGRRADAIAALVADPARIDELLAYVFAGFAPRNPAMAAAAHDAGTPGAVAAVLPPGTLAAWDTFADPLAWDVFDHTGQAGASYTRHPATTAVATNAWRLSAAGRAYCAVESYSAPQAAHYLLSGVAAAAAHDLVAVWRFLSHLGDSQHGLTFRYDAALDSGYRLLYQSYFTFRCWILQRVDLGTVTPLGTYALEPSVGSDTTIRVELRDDGITVRFDGIARITSPDVTYTAAGRVGLYGTGTSGSTDTTGMHLSRIAVGTPGVILPGYELAGPVRGAPLAAAGPFTVALATGVNPGSVLVTPTTTGTLAGTFSPPSVTLADGDRSKTITFVPSGLGSGTIVLEDSGSLVDPPALAFQAGYFPPARLPFWESHLHDRHSSGPAPYQVGTGSWLDGSEHYDVISCLQNARDYCIRKSLGPTDWDPEIAAGVVRYRDRAVIAVGVQGYHLNATGLLRHHLETADPIDLVAIEKLLPAVGIGVDSFRKLYSPAGLVRETAYVGIACLDRERAGMGEHPLVDAAVECMLLQIDQVTADPGTYYGTWIKPWMSGLTCRSLIAYWDRYCDVLTGPRGALVAAIPAAIERLLAHLWTHLWFPVGTPAGGPGGWTRGALMYALPATADPAMAPITGTIQSAASGSVFTGPGSLSSVDDFYKYATVDFPGSTHGGGGILGYDGTTKQFLLNPYSADALTAGMTFTIKPVNATEGDGPGVSPVLNPMLAPAYAWAYWHRKVILGDAAGAAVHRLRHDQMFDGSQQSWEATDSQKVWNQSLLWGTQGLLWRDRGDAEWPAATTFTLLAPATGAAGDTGTASGPFRLALPAGVKVAACVLVTPAASTGRGTFGTSGSLFTADRPWGLFTFDPAVLDDGSTVGVSATAAGLSAPGAVPFAVGTPSSPTARVLLIPSPAGGILLFARPAS